MPTPPSTPPNSPPIIEVTDLVCAFGEDVILADVDLTVAPGEIFVIVGGSGSGKSTLLKHIIGLVPPASGSIRIGGIDIHESQAAYEQAIGRFGVAYQSGALFGSMTVVENVRLPMEERADLPKEAMDMMACQKLAQVGLSGYERHFPSEISGGMQKRAAIARAMALDPDILFLDEPSAGLDPITSAELDDLILRLRATMNMTFVIVSHELASIYSIADRVVLLDKSAKNIIAQGTFEELYDHENPAVRRFFQRGQDNREPMDFFDIADRR